jgi:hypothetical protein
MKIVKLAWLSVAGLGCSSAPDAAAPHPVETFDSMAAPSMEAAAPAANEAPLSEAAAPAADEASLSEAMANVEVNLERLRALSVFEVRDLVVKQPGEADNCYGLPCSDTSGTAAERESRAALRLARLADAAENAVNSAYAATQCIERVDLNLAALRDLEVVDVGEFMRIEPANNPYCYNLPCGEDLEAAAVANEARAADLESIAHAAESL